MDECMTGTRRSLLSEKKRQQLAGRLAAIDHRGLLGLHEVAGAGSVRGAAERLGISASALSRQVARMEEDLGIMLLERHGRGARVTEAGALLNDYFEEQRARLDGVVAQLQDITEARRGQISLGTGEGFLWHLMRGPLRGFAQAHPQLHMELSVGSTDQLVAQLLDDSIQMAVLYNLPPDPRLQSHAARRHPMRIVVAPGHPLHRLGRKITLQDLRQHRLGMLTGSHGVRQLLLSAEHGERVRLEPQLRSNSARALLRFAEEWGGVVITAAFAVAPEVLEKRLVALEAESGILEGAEAQLVTRRGRRLSPAAQQLLRHLAAHTPILRAS
ncbi:LysR family transcriptional regulator [Rhodovarius crocodyli]|uniref:LysR family transcriptional regulator n=2 Tax=Rhodovarius crocodyli TaxID=1979269 RepID=A0A437LX70_9PROT|nr:LysR family transcriptional regulator [Rhodovarius crocodyli]